MVAPFFVIRASRKLMPEVCQIINSNTHQYRDIITSPAEFAEYLVNETWVNKNFPNREFYLARYRQRYVGMATFQVIKDFGYIGYFHIKASEQRQGFGEKLLEFLKLRAKTDSLSKIRLFVHKDAEWAQNFYRKNGFILKSSNMHEIDAMEEGVLAPYHASDHILLELSI